jgi:hypothetical protein
MNVAEEAQSSSARALTSEPSGASICTSHVMSNNFASIPMAAQDCTVVDALGFSPMAAEVSYHPNVGGCSDVFGRIDISERTGNF